MFRRRILVLAALAVPACDVPTEPPMWEQTWVVPGDEIVVGVADLLPAGVAVSDDGAAFETTVPGFDLELTLASMCSACVALDGSTAPKPAYSHTINTMTELPAELVSASLTGDQFELVLAHDLSFDPLRPSADPADERGYVVIEVTSDGTVVARDSLSGNDWAFTAASPLTPTLAIQPVDVTRTLDVAVTIYSPAGDPVEVDTSDTLGVSLLPATATISGVTVEATGITVDAPAANLELDVDSTLVERVQSGALRLDVQNPFELAGTLDLAFDLGAETIQKSVTLSSGASAAVVSFTGDELRDVLAAGDVVVTAQGTLSSPGGTVTVTPTQELVMDADFEIVVLVGGSEGDE